ncbi:MAG: GTPase Era [Saprospiraceae bacterium]
MSNDHYSGFVNLFGNPNVGKSTLVKVLCGQKLAIISDRPQTTRHRIFVIYNDDAHQVVFSDAPGRIREPKYKLQERMNLHAHSGLRDADILLFVTTPDEAIDENIIPSLTKLNVPIFLVINKCDINNPVKVEACKKDWQAIFEFKKTFTVSALTMQGIDELKDAILTSLPIGPAYYPKEDLSDRHERFFVAELVRETIFETYYEEIPYSCEIQINDFSEIEKDGKPFAKIYVYIIVERESQKGIILGKNGSSIKELGIKSRQKIEEFLGHSVHLDLQVKVENNWRNNPEILKRYGY